MSRLELRTTIRAPKQCCFDVSRDIDVHVASMKSAGERAVGGVTTGLIGLGEDVTWRARHFGVTWRMTSRITACDAPTRFVDETVRGPFAAFRHEHQFEQHGDTTAMLDVVDYGYHSGSSGPSRMPWSYGLTFGGC